jgi:hypothetical protein
MSIRDVLLVHHSHTDIGYTNYQDSVFAMNREYLRRAMDLAEAYADGQPGEQFKWTCETTIMVEDFIQHAGPQEVERLVNLHRRGLIAFGGMYCNLTPLYPAEMLARTLYAAGRLRREYGLDVRYALNCDVNGQSWGMVEMLLDAGFEGLGMAINRVMARDPQPRPVGFWWRGPSGRRLLVWHGEHYGHGHTLGIPRAWTPGAEDAREAYNLDLARERLSTYVAGLEQQGYAYDFIYFQITSTFLWDNGGPHEELVRFVRDWNARGWQPRMQIVTLGQFFERLAQQPAASLETQTGDWTDWWAHGVASSAFETALVRRNHARLFAAEGLGALLQGMPQAPAYPAGEDQQAWRSLALYDEHTWGAFDSVTYASSPNSRGQWHRKATYAYEGTAAVTRLTQHVQRNLAARLEQPAAVQVLVYNPLPWPRRVLLLLPPVPRLGWDNDQLERSLELASAQGPVMPIEDYGMVDLPACGYVSVPLRHPAEKVIPAESRSDPQRPVFTPRPAPGLMPTGGVRHHGWTMENRFYRLAIDPGSGGIGSLVDLASGHEWVDSSMAWHLGEYVYEEVRSSLQRSDMQLQFFPPFVPDHDHQPALAPIRSGPQPVLAQQFMPGVGASRLSLRLAAPGVSDLEVQVVLYDDLPWIDLIYDLNKLAVTTAESIYVAFPFNLSQPVARYEVAGAIVQAEAQQMRYATRDFYAIQNWVDLSNDQLGVTVASPDAPMLHLGGFTNHKYLAAMQLEQPLLVGWPVNNHWFTNFRGSQSGWLRFRYRLLPHTAPFDAVAATRFGAEAAVEPLLGPVWDRPAGLERRAVPAPVHLPEQTSFLVLEPAHVHLIGLKPAANGQGITLRLQELAGQPADFRLHFPHSQVVSAEVCSLLEERIDGPQPVAAGHEVRGQIEPYRLQTLRVVLSAQ